MRVLITGGAGFIGSHLVDLLFENGHEIVVFDNLDPQVHPDGWPDSLLQSSGVVLLRGDVRDAQAVSWALTEDRKGSGPFDVVIHLAAKVGVGQGQYEIKEYYDVNVKGTAVLLQEMLGLRERGRQIPRLFVAGSMSSYGEGLYVGAEGAVRPKLRDVAAMLAGAWEHPGLTPVPIPETEPMAPASFYAATKAEQERMALLFGQAYGVPVWVGRFFNAYGTRQALGNPYTGVVAIFGNQLLAGERPTIYEDGAQTRDFINVKDLVRAIGLLVAGPGDTAGVYNIGTGQGTSVQALAEALAETLGVSLPPKVTGAFRSGDIRHCLADVTKLRGLGWAPEVTLREGLKDLLAWLHGQRGVRGLQGRAALEMEARGLLVEPPSSGSGPG